MNLLLVAHGTRKPAGVKMVGDLAQRVSELLDKQVRVAFVDVLGPTPREVLSASTIVVPAFLACGYHVNTDIPAHATASGHTDAIITPPVGPSPQLVRVLSDRLVESGWRQDDSVLLAAAGTSDPAAQRDLYTTATRLSAVISSRMELCFARDWATASGRRSRRAPPWWCPPRRGGVVLVVRRPFSESAAGQRCRHRDRATRYPPRHRPARRQQVPPGAAANRGLSAPRSTFCRLLTELLLRNADLGCYEPTSTNPSGVIRVR